jgi:hypothetical protein
MTHWRERVAFCFDARNPDALVPMDAAQRRDAKIKITSGALAVLAFGFIWLLGYLWTLLPPPVTSFARLDNSTGAQFTGSILNAVALLLFGTYLYEGYGACRELATGQCRRVVDDEDQVAGVVGEARCYMPLHTKNFVTVTVGTACLAFAFTIGLYLFALLGAAVWPITACNRPANATTVLCWHTKDECLCGLLTSIAVVLIGCCVALLFLVSYGCYRVLPRARLALKDDEEIPLLKAEAVVVHGAV